MKQTINPVSHRIEWCRRQSAQASTEPEVDGWRAEADGLLDAITNSDHTDDYRLYPPEIFQRYVLGFQDGMAMLRTARVDIMYGTATETPYQAPSMRQDLLPGDEQ